MFTNALRMENGKLYRRHILWMELGVLAILMLIVYAGVYTEFRANPSAEGQMANAIFWPNGLSQFVDFAGGNSFGGYLAIILVATVTAQEYTWRTMSLWLSRGLSRSTLMAAKFVSFLVPLLLIVLTAGIVGALGTGLITYNTLGTLNLNQVDFARVGLNLVYTAYTLLPYVSLTFLLVVVTHSVAAAISVGIAYSLVVEGLAVQLLSAAGSGLAEVGKYLPGSLAQSLLLNRGLVEVEGSAVTSLLLGSGPAAVLIAGYTILFLGLATWAFHRQDITT